MTAPTAPSGYPMAAPAIPADLRPRLRPEVVLGPPLLQGAAVVHHVKDQRTGWFFQIGPREHFVFSRLDGTATAAEIGAAYAERFGRRLGDAHWQQLLGLLASRRLLAGTEDEAALQAIADAARDRSLGTRTITHARLPLVAPDRKLAALERLLRPLLRPAVAWPVLAAVVAVQVLVLTRVPALVHDTRAVWQWPLLGVLSVVVTWLSLALHETAHGVACKHFGGQVSEIGVMWRFPLLAPYCKADDVMLFHNRWHRVGTAFAGVLTTLALLVPFGLLYVLSAPGSGPHTLAGAILLIGSASALLNLVPFLQLDGYFMLNHALGMVNLRVDSYRYYGGLLSRLRGRSTGPAAVPGRVRAALLVYGAASVLFGLGLLTVLVVSWFGQLDDRLGPVLATAILAAEAVLLTLVALYFRRRLARRAAGAT